MCDKIPKNLDSTKKGGKWQVEDKRAAENIGNVRQILEQTPTIFIQHLGQ